MGVGGQRQAPAALTPREWDLVPIVQEVGWDPGPVWTGAENLALPAFDPRTVQPVASRYTDWAVTSKLTKYVYISKRNRDTKDRYVHHTDEPLHPYLLWIWVDVWNSWPQGQIVFVTAEVLPAVTKESCLLGFHSHDIGRSIHFCQYSVCHILEYSRCIFRTCRPRCKSTGILFETGWRPLPSMHY